MKKKFYFIEIIATATPENKNFAGDVHRYVYGRKEELIAYETVKNVSGSPDHLRKYNNTDMKWAAIEYGFKSAKMAETIGKRLHANDDIYNGITNWKNKMNIIEVEWEV